MNLLGPLGPTKSARPFVYVSIHFDAPQEELAQPMGYAYGVQSLQLNSKLLALPVVSASPFNEMHCRKSCAIIKAETRTIFGLVFVNNDKDDIGGCIGSA